METAEPMSLNRRIFCVLPKRNVSRAREKGMGLHIEKVVEGKRFLTAAK